MSGETRIKINNAQFLTRTLIERCPRTMMIRELVMNAIEAAGQVGGEVRFKVVHVEGCSGRKLGIFNDGPGMDAETLLEMCDLASSGKTLGLDDNFGMGAKVASLGSNHAGLRYWSCKDGVVNEVTMGHDGEEYVIFSYEGDPSEAIDVTEAAAKAGYPLDRDWTEVVLFGMDGDQDTVIAPYGEPLHKQWIGTELLQRFDSIPGGVTIKLMEGTNPRDTNRRFAPFHEKVAPHGQIGVETDGETGVSVRYMFNEMRDDGSHLMSAHGSISTARIGAGLVYKNEIYEILHGQKWGANAPAFGVTFGSKQLSVMVMLPDDYPVRPEQYRRFLNYVEGDKEQVPLDDFREVVLRCMPQWFKDRVQQFMPASAATMDALQRRLQDWMNRRRNAPPRPKPGAGPMMTENDDVPSLPSHAHVSEDVAERRPASGGEGRDPRPDGETLDRTPRQPSRPHARVAPEGSRPAALSVSRGVAPRIVQLYEASDVEEKGFVGKAAKFEPVTDTLFVNMGYAAVREAKETFAREYAAAVARGETEEGMVAETAEMAIVQAVGYAVAYALVKYGQPDWNREDIKVATSPQSLSVAADGWENGASEIKRGLAKRLGRSTVLAKAA